MKEAEIERRRRHGCAGEHGMRLAAMMGLVIEEMDDREIHRQGQFLAIGHAAIGEGIAVARLWHFRDQPQDAMILNLPRRPEMLGQLVWHFIEAAMRHRQSFKAGEPAAIADIEMIEGAADRPEEAIMWGAEIMRRKLAHGSKEPFIGPAVIARQ